MAKVAEHVYVCQRTPVYCAPRDNAEYDQGWIDRVANEEGFMDRKRAEFMAAAQNESMHLPVRVHTHGNTTSFRVNPPQ